ncbi:MAG: heat-inducible transcriptional repressor HrcA [Bacillota bacterium]|jgi:heat-inducible transcriptional repressor|nr:heat-inducible transcription repressor HrcA [Bacillota bacterium]
MADAMGQRKQAVLRAVTDDYISTAEPVGSRTIARKYGLGVSPATIRNEMADLEEEGYLEQPHASAGRIPSDKGYRFYVDSLMLEKPISKSEEVRIRKEYQRRRDSIISLIRATARVLGEMSQYASVVIGPTVKGAEIRHIQLVPLSSDTVLVVVVTNSGLVEHRVLTIEHAMSLSDLDRISWVLNNKLRGSTLSDMRGRLLKEIQAEVSAYTSFLENMFELLIGAMRTSDTEKVHVEGVMQLLAQPEFREIEKARPVLEFLESDELVLRELSASARASRGTEVTIGSEHALEELRNCSIVSAPYGPGGQMVGAVAVIGPTRMDYAMATALVGYMAEQLSELLTRLDWYKSAE